MNTVRVCFFSLSQHKSRDLAASQLRPFRYLTIISFPKLFKIETSHCLFFGFCFSSLYLFPFKVILEDLPDEFASALREYNRQVTDVFSQYLTAVAADLERERGEENKLPLSGIGKIRFLIILYLTFSFFFHQWSSYHELLVILAGSKIFKLSHGQFHGIARLWFACIS